MQEILGDVVNLTRAEMDLYFRTTLLKEWNVGLNNKFELIYNTRALGLKAIGTSNYYLEFFDEEGNDHTVSLPSGFDVELNVEDSLADLDSDKITVNTFFQFGSTSTEDGIYENLNATLTCERARILSLESQSLDVKDSILLEGKLKLTMEDTTLLIEYLITGRVYECVSYDEVSPLYDNFLKITKDAQVRYIPISDSDDYKSFRTPLKIGGLYVLTNMKFNRPSQPIITQKGYGKMLLESDVNSRIMYNGEDKPSGSVWKNLTSGTLKGDAIAYFPEDGEVERSDDSLPTYITMLGYPDLFQRPSWNNANLINSNSVNATLRAFRIDDETDWDYYQQYFEFNANQRRSVLESFFYKDVFDDILQVQYSHRWAFESLGDNIVDSAIIGWRGNHGIIEKITEWTFDDYDDFPWTYIIETE